MFQWLHKIGPGFVILLSVVSYFISFILQLLVTIGLPNIRGIYFLGYTLVGSGQQTRIGLWTICTDQTYIAFFGTDSGQSCQPSTLGYEDTQYGPIADYLLIHSLSKALVVQPISCAFAAIAAASGVLHICTNFIVWPFIGALAGILAILTFVFEIILFSVARSRLSNDDAVSNLGQGIESVGFGAGIWLQLVGMIIVVFAVFAQWTAYTRRKVRRTHPVGAMGKRDSASIRSYRASTTTSDPPLGGAYSKKRMSGVPPSSSSRTNGHRPSSTTSSRAEYGEDIALKDMSAPIATGAGEKSYTAARRKRVPKYTDNDDEEDQPTSAPPRNVTRRASDVSENDTFEDATDVGVVDDDRNDDTVRHILGGRPTSATRSASSHSHSLENREPLTEMQDTIVSPRRGKRAARYSARMAEDGEV